MDERVAAGVDLQQHRVGVAPEQAACPLREHGAAAERDDGGLAPLEHVGRDCLLDRTEGRLAAGEVLLHGPPATTLDLGVEIDEGAAETLGHVRAHRALARAHEAHEREVAL